MNHEMEHIEGAEEAQANTDPQNETQASEGQPAEAAPKPKERFDKVVPLNQPMSAEQAAQIIADFKGISVQQVMDALVNLRNEQGQVIFEESQMNSEPVVRLSAVNHRWWSNFTAVVGRLLPHVG